MKTTKGSALFLVRFTSDTAPFDSKAASPAARRGVYAGLQGWLNRASCFRSPGSGRGAE